MKPRYKHKPYSEENLQCAVAEYLHSAMPSDIPWTAIETSGRGAKDGARQRAKGVNAGWPDLQFLLLSGFVGIELKRPAVASIGQKKGVQQANQKHAQKLIEGIGHYYHIAYSVREVEKILRGYGVVLKSRAF